MNILVTGGLGYIGSHTISILIESKYKVVILDNLSNSSITTLNKLKNIINKEINFIEGDINNKGLLKEIIKKYKIEAVIHFAGLKSVNESIENPQLYYKNNVQGSLMLFEAMQETGVTKLVFSSSATVYGIPEYLPIDEAHPTKPINPYGQTKLDIENILLDLRNTNPSWKIISLRYFNPVGAHPSGKIGEDPNEIPNNLMPYISKVASKELSKLKIFGDSYNTIDGTGVRDYIHVMDLADGHLASLEYINDQFACFETLNLGTGNGYSVLQILSAFEQTNNIQIPYEICDPRPGDVDSCYAEIAKSINILGWSPKRGIMEMCKSAWDYESKKKIN